MPFLAACPFCPTKIRLPEQALGASIRCPKCSNHFTAAPEESALASPTPYLANRARRIAAASRAAQATTARRRQHANRGNVAAAEGEPAATPRVPPMLEPSRRAQGVNEWAALALGLGGVGLLTAFFASRWPAVSFLH